MAHLKVINGNLLLPISGMEKRLFSRETIVRAVVGGRIISEKSRRYVQCLKDINITLSAGDRLGLIGHNGAGKTSLLRALSGIYPLGSGELSVSGRVSTFISQGFGLNPEMTAADYLELQCIVRNYDSKQAEDFIEEVLTFIELGEFAYMPIRTYSAGMRARLLASTALFFPCDVLLIDEGIGAGDSQFSKKFNTKLDDFFAAAKILVLASHNRELLKKWCTKVAVMSRGEIVFIGGVTEALEFYDKLMLAGNKT